MKRLAFLLLAFVSATALAQTNVRVRGTITSLSGDTLAVKTREGRDVQVHLAPDTTVAVAKKGTAADFKPGTYAGVTSVKGPDGRLVAKRIHAIGPQVPQMHGAWDSIPNSMMTNANIEKVAQSSGGNELTMKYKGGEEKILVTPETEYYTFTNGSREDLKPGAMIFTNARVADDGKFMANRVAVGKDGVNPPQ
jgi:hypothetical protein